MNKKLYIYTFYRFIDVPHKDEVKRELDRKLKNLGIRGTILLAYEGINGSLSGPKQSLEISIKIIKYLLKIRKLEIKINKNSFIPFNRLKIRVKKEIVSLGQGNINVNKFRGELINPENWNQVIKDKNVRLIDVRNIFEIDIGSFKRSERPMTKSFREFPNSIKKLKLEKDNKIAMYCTGGIRCEKASAFMRKKGYKNVAILNGGIIKYLEYMNSSKGNSLWNGECFVFDNRVTIDKKLTKGKYIQCYGCRRPITKKDTLSVKYIKGVSCPYCYNERSVSQKNRSRVRQNQIEEAKRSNKYNVFLKN